MRILCLISLGFLIGCQSTIEVLPNKSAVMPSHYLPLGFCSRSNPPDYEATWEPTQDVIDDMESRFRQLQRLSATQCCISGARVSDVNEYVRHYFGLVVQGQRMIYINAVRHHGRRDMLPKYTFPDRCDGGDCCWGVLYDPKQHKFFDLAFNGMS